MAKDGQHGDTDMTLMTFDEKCDYLKVAYDRLLNHPTRENFDEVEALIMNLDDHTRITFVEQNPDVANR